MSAGLAWAGLLLQVWAVLQHARLLLATQQLCLQPATSSRCSASARTSLRLNRARHFTRSLTRPHACRSRTRCLRCFCRGAAAVRSPVRADLADFSCTLVTATQPLTSLSTSEGLAVRLRASKMTSQPTCAASASAEAARHLTPTNHEQRIPSCSPRCAAVAMHARRLCSTWCACVTSAGPMRTVLGACWLLPAAAAASGCCTRALDYALCAACGGELARI